MQDQSKSLAEDVEKEKDLKEVTKATIGERDAAL